MLKEFMAKANFEQVHPHQKCLVRSWLLNPKRDQNRLLLPKDGHGVLRALWARPSDTIDQAPMDFHFGPD